MPTSRKHRPVSLLATIAIVVFALAATADPLGNPPPVTWAWSPPTEGPPVDHYRVELRVDDDDWVFQGTTEDTTFTLEFFSYTAYMHQYRLRVQAVANGRTGPYSPASTPWVPDVPDPPPPGG